MGKKRKGNITERDFKKIKKLHGLNLTHKVIGEILGWSPGTSSRVACCDSWEEYVEMKKKQNDEQRAKYPQVTSTQTVTVGETLDHVINLLTNLKNALREAQNL